MLGDAKLNVMPNQKLFKVVGFVGLVILASKILGLARDLVIAKVYGTSIVADAYNFAYLLTGNVLVLIGGIGGPFHSATIAILTKIKNNAKESGSFLIRVLGLTFIVLVVVAAFVILFRDKLIQIILPGAGLSNFYREKLWEITSVQLLIMSPLIVISGLVGIFCGVANVYRGYFWPSFGPALPSIAIIVLVLYFNDPACGIALALGTLIGALLELLVQLPYVAKGSVLGNLKFELIKGQKAVSDFWSFLGPALLSTTVGQFTVYIDGFFCSGLPEGSWTSTVFANRLIQLPLGILVTSFLVPFFPRFSELAGSKKIDELKQTSFTVIRSLWFLTLPVVIYLFLFAKPVVEVIFQRGAFDERSTILVSSILVALLLSMVAYVARDTLTRVFYSLGDSKTPLVIALIAIVVKIILNALLVKKYQAPGIAFVTSLVTLFNFLLLFYLLRKKIGCLGWSKHLRPVTKMLTASFVMFLFGLLFLSLYPIHVIAYDFISKVILVFTSFSVCMLVYFGLALTMRLEEAQRVIVEVKNKLFS